MKHILIAITLLLTIQNIAQLKQLSIEDCELGYWKGLYPSSLMNLQWAGTDKQYSYITLDSKRENTNDTIYVKNASTNSKMAEHIITTADIKKSNVDAERFYSITWLDASSFYYTSGNSFYSYNYQTKKGEKRISFSEKAENKDYNKDYNLMAYTIDNNLYIANGKEIKIPVFESSNKNIVTGQAIHRFEFGISKGTFWSPKGTALAFSQKDETNVADYPLLDINETPGKLTSIKYPMAGQPSEHGKIGIYNIASGKTIFLQTGEPLDHYLTNLSWGPNEEFIYLAEVNREQNHMWFNKYDVKTGEKVKTLFEEQMKEWAEPEHPAFFIPASNTEFLWLSERDGFQNIYHYNTDGKLIKQVTDHKWVTNDILGFSKDAKTVFIKGTSADPRENHTFAIDIKTGKETNLTKAAGTHNTQLSPNKTALIDNWSSLTVPKQIDIVNVKSLATNTIHTSENPLADWEIGTTEFLTLESEDGFDLYGRIIKPRNFDASKKYPVLVYVYGGPHAQLVTNNWLGGARLWMHYMASQGYIVFTLDGRGSGERGYDFEKVIHRHLGDNEMKDQLLGVDYLKSLKYVDSDRMAVHGWSFGGFMTTSLMTRYPGTFTTGVAGGPVIDWKWYEIMYGERYMDTPEQNPEGYKTASLMQYVKNLEGNLLMIHGTVDDVVVMQHNLAFVQACVSAGVQIDFFPYPMHKHNVRGRDRVHLMTKILNYIIEENK